jgi:hypothetical protein
VLGVVTKDSARASVEAAKDIHLTFPSVLDSQSTVEGALGRVALPITVFVDTRGQVTSVYNSVPLTDATLRAQIRQHLGVDVP